jgi:branched-chain amino acid transport system permease protein
MKTSAFISLICGFVLVAALVIVPIDMARYGLYILSMWTVMTIAAIGLNLTLGYAGQISLVVKTNRMSPS